MNQTHAALPSQPRSAVSAAGSGAGARFVIRRVAVLGSGVMGSRIAAHLAGAGLQVLLLDIPPRSGEAPTDPSKARLWRSSVAQGALDAAVKASPSPVYEKSMLGRIEVGNFDDDLPRIAECDWTIEVVVENLDIKRSLYERVEAHRKAGSIITSNTSGIPINLLAKGRSEDFRRHFLGTHFFNPPRYLPLLEIIPTADTRPELVSFMMHFGDRVLGKTTVLAQDTPAFIANRVGVFAIMDVFSFMGELGLTVEQIDKLTGPVIGHPKSATFRTSDVVGLDTLIKVAEGLYHAAPDDEQRDRFAVPDFLRQMEQRGWLGDKTGQGFYRKTGSGAKKTIEQLDLKTLEYVPQDKPRFATLEKTKSIDRLSDRWPVLIAGQDEAGAFYRRMVAGLLSYSAHRVGEITPDLYRIDDALKAGFGWEQGPFETWDAIGIRRGAELVKEQGFALPAWVDEALNSGIESWYGGLDAQGSPTIYDLSTKGQAPIPGREGFIILRDLAKAGKKVWGNAGATAYDLGEGVLGLEFHTKMNTMGAEVIEGINRAITMAERDWAGLVIGNEGQAFSAGANLAMVLMFAIEQDYDELDMMIRQFQATMMRARYSSVPVVVAPHNLTLGGGCELTMHADAVQAAAETYIGLVEVGVGVIPGGGGTKEMALRASDAYENGDPEVNTLTNVFMNIATAKVATSAHEAYGMRILRQGTDRITLNRQRLIADARVRVLELAFQGYVMPTPRTDIKVLGRTALGTLMAGIEGMRVGRYATDHDALVARKLAYVICGGDLSYPQRVSEKYMLDLEREAFLSLCGERKTLERIQAVLQTGKPVRN